MKVKYKDFILEAHKEKCLGGWNTIYYSAVRDSDGWFLDDGFSDSDDILKTIINGEKITVDDYYENPNNYES